MLRSDVYARKNSTTKPVEKKSTSLSSRGWKLVGKFRENVWRYQSRKGFVTVAGYVYLPPFSHLGLARSPSRRGLYSKPVAEDGTKQLYLA